MAERESFIENTKETDERLEALKQLYPEIFSEGKINLDAFKDITNTGNLSPEEDKTPGYYGLYWPGKRKAKQLAKKEAEGTLEPVLGDGVNEDSTHNIYIEGDNLEVLRILKQSYKGRVKMIYIDPPYNTGGDFIYPDDYSMPVEEYLKMTGQTDESGKKLVTNAKSNGAFHTNWLNMMYSRLQLARELLADDGVIFISIDDNEYANLKLLCDDIFGEENFITNLVWEKKKKGSFLANDITNIKEYIYVYAKNKTDFAGLIGEINTEEETYPCVNASNPRDIRIIPYGIASKYREKDFYMKKGEIISDTTMDLVLLSDLVIKNGVLAEDLVIEGNWRYSKEAMIDYAKKNELYITRDLYLRRIVKEPRYKGLKDLLLRVGENNESGYKYEISELNLQASGWGSNEDADEEQRLLFGEQSLMSYPKPVLLIMKLLLSTRKNNMIVCDFFSGSATTAEAVMRTNYHGNNKYILVQVPLNFDLELLHQTGDEKKQIEKDISYLESLHLKHNICELAKERIRRAGKKIKEENPSANLDIGFRVYRLNKSNFKKYTPVSGQDETAKETLFGELQGNLVPLVDGWKKENVLTEIILRQGFALDCKVEKLTNFTKNTIYKIEDSLDVVRKNIKLYVCLDPAVVKETIEALSLGDDEKFICLDSAIDDTSYARLYDKGKIETI